MKKRIAKLIGGLQFNEIHQRVMAPGVNHILTTNYDYGFEIASGQDNIRSNLMPESKYSVFRRRAVGAQDNCRWPCYPSYLDKLPYMTPLLEASTRFAGATQSHIRTAEFRSGTHWECK